MYSQETLSDMSELELAAVAKSEFQLTLDADKATKQQMITAILEVQGDASARLHATEPQPSQASKRFRVIIHDQDGVDNTPFVPIGVNGFTYQIPRNTEVVLPAEAVEVLEHAIYERPEKSEDGKSMRMVQHRRFPYTIVGEAA